MKVDELAEELADFWFPAINDADWQKRLSILTEVHSQLCSDIGARSPLQAQAVCQRFLAVLIERLGMPAIESDVQARIYASSAHSEHRAAARIWADRAGQTLPPDPGILRDERRRFPRYPVHTTCRMWIGDDARACKLLNLSRGGARVQVPDLELDTGTVVRLEVPTAGVKEARVVFRGPGSAGLYFSSLIPAA